MVKQFSVRIPIFVGEKKGWRQKVDGAVSAIQPVRSLRNIIGYRLPTLPWSFFAIAKNPLLLQKGTVASLIYFTLFAIFGINFNYF